MVLASIAKRPIAPTAAVAPGFFGLSFLTSPISFAPGLALVELALADRHHEGLAPGRRPPGEVLRDLGDPALRRRPPFAEADLAQNCELVVEVAVAQAFEAGDLGGDPGLAHEPFVARRDRLGERELVCLRACVSMRRTLRSPAMAASMKRALRSRICQPVASTLRFVA